MASILDSYSLKGKVAIVVGAGGAIGRAISLAYGQAGARLGALIFIVNAAATALQITEEGGQARSFRVDVTQEDEVGSANRCGACRIWRRARPCQLRGHG